MAALSREELLRLARAGASARVQALQAELEGIYRTFPELRRGTSGKASAARPGERGKRGWTAANRKAVSERMKKYWAARRASEARAAAKSGK